MASYLWKGRAIRAQLSMTGEGWDKLHPDMQRIAVEVIREAQLQGLNVGVLEGWRDAETQKKYMGAGTSWVGDVDGSYHRWGLACDFVFLDSLGRWTWDPDNLGDGADQSKSPSWQKLGAIIEKHGLGWGGRFKTFDGPHGELRLMSIAALKATYGNPEALAWA